MSNKKYVKCYIKSMSVELPLVLSNGLDDAVLKYKITKADLVRSVLYDFLISSGITPEYTEFDAIDDILIDLGKHSKLLNVE